MKTGSTYPRKTGNLVYISIFTALIIVMGTVPFLGYIPLGVIRATTVHIPVILGSILLGPKAGAVLGGVFGLTSFLTNTFTPNLTSFVFTPFYSLGDVHGNAFSLLICFVPRILTGVVPYFVCRGLMYLFEKRKWNDLVPLGVAGFAGAMTNTLLVMNLIFVFFRDSYAQVQGMSSQVVYGAILTIIGTNGVVEAIVAAVLVGAIGHILRKVRKKTAF